MRKKTRASPKKGKIMPAVPKTTFFPIVGIGASAGGLEAYQDLLRNLPAKPGMAFVFVMHLAPEHKSLLAELLARLTKMPVREIKNGMPIEVNNVYVKPPDTNLSIAGVKLILSERNDKSVKHMPIDCFFRSLADELGNRAIGVILSGTATDGTLGAEAIKAEGGITFAQDEKTAKYDGMPQSAIAAGCVDFVLSPKKIARELERIAKHPFVSFAGPVKTDKSTIIEDKGIESVFDILRSATGLDFTHYKTPTISRRVSRRMVLLKLENIRGYTKFLRENKDEVEKLYEDLLINVTNFFRDPKVFDALKKQVLPAILKNRTKGQGVRIWVPGCSSGEEAYSIAMCLLEVLGNKASAVPVQIFSTDVREDSINKARTGIYGKNIKNSITPERLKRFFTKTGDSYRISKQLREMCIFSRQNVFSDPPFSNLDLISCRNLLIYLRPVLQKKVFHNFHYGLKPGGFLLLGNSEAAGGYLNLFKALDVKNRFFAKKYLSITPELELSQKYYPSNRLEIKEKADIEKGKEADIESIVERIVLDEYAPCGVLIDSDMKVVQFRGHTGRFLESAAGKPSHDIFKLVREGLLMPLRSAIYKAGGTKHTVKRETDTILHNGRRTRVKITVVPVESGPLKEKFFLVLFDEIAGAAGSKNLPKAHGIPAKDEKYVESMQKELTETKEYLQTVIEEQESANEEVKTANEEILSSNEELQSTNEELETAKEELQSSNEELITTNEELQKRNIESFLLNNDLVNLLGSINMPVVMMGTDLVIRRVTPQAEKALNIISSDVGRPISKIKLNVDIPNFKKMLLDVIETLHPKTFEIEDREGMWYSVNIRPYRTLDNKIDGVVAIFVDITERKKSRQKIEEARAYAETIIETMREPLIVLDTDLKIISANRSFYQTFKVNHKETQGRFIYDLGNRQWDIPKLRQLLEEILPKNNTFDGYEIEHDFETIGPKTMLFNARRLAAMQMILITIEDITERKKAEDKIKELCERQKSILGAVPDILMEVNNDKVYTWANQAGYDFFGEDVIGKEAAHYFEDDQKTYDIVQPVFDGKEGATYLESWQRRKDGQKCLLAWWCVALKDGNGKVTGALSSATDITERKKAEQAIKTSQERLLFATEGANIGIWNWDTVTGELIWSDKCKALFGIPLDETMSYARFRDALHPDDRDRTDKAVNDAISNHKDYDIEYRSLWPDGSIHWLAAKGRGYYDATGKGIRLEGIVLDITERKNAEEELKSSLSLLSTSLESTADGILIVDRKGKLTRWNQKFIDMWKIPEEVISSRDDEKTINYILAQLAAPEQFVAKVRKLYEQPEESSFDQVEFLDSRVFERYSQPQRIGDDIVGRVWSFRDITEQKKAAEATAQTAREWQTTFDSARDGIWLLDKERHVLRSNKMADQIFHSPCGKAVGQHCWEIAHCGTTGPIPECPIQRMRQSLCRETMELLIGECWYQVTADPILDAAGQYAGAVHTVSDITERKKNEMDLKKANEELIKFNDLKDEFVSMASHELRTPLSIISGAVKLLSDEIPGKIVSGQKEMLDMATNNLNRLARIVDSLLNISKIESGKIELCRTDADICHIIAETVNEYSLQAEKKQINLSCQLPVHPVILRADADRIKEVVVNLISNSIKFTPQGGSINVFCEDRNNDVLVFVKDTGCGVAKDDVPRMFEKFTQFSRKAGPGEKGTGLGLAICKGLVNLHNGKIWAESDTGGGMKISFTIPRLSAEHILTESADNAVESSLKTGGGMPKVNAGFACQPSNKA
jgi:two-component system CheB/CheR fusion protein